MQTAIVTVNRAGKRTVYQYPVFRDSKGVPDRTMGRERYRTLDHQRLNVPVITKRHDESASRKMAGMSFT